MNQADLQVQTDQGTTMVTVSHLTGDGSDVDRVVQAVKDEFDGTDEQVQE